MDVLFVISIFFCEVHYFIWTQIAKSRIQILTKFYFLWVYKDIGLSKNRCILRKFMSNLIKFLICYKLICHPFSENLFGVSHLRKIDLKGLINRLIYRAILTWLNWTKWVTSILPRWVAIACLLVLFNFIFQTFTGFTFYSFIMLFYFLTAII